MLPSDYACPRCKCHACYALHRKGFDWVISLLGLRPARCLTCTRRFYARYTLSENGKYILESGPVDGGGSKTAADEDSGRRFDTAA